MTARTQRYAVSICLALAIVSIGRLAEAQNLRVVPVPWVATDPSIPHQAYNGRATVFKAIARGGNGTYDIRWDFDGDGTFDFSATRTNRYDLSASFTYPDQAATTTFHAVIEVTSNGQTVTGTYPVRVFADVPTNPATATDRQLQVMRGVAVDDALWYLHLQMSRPGNEEHPLTGAQVTGNLSTGNAVAATAGYLWALSLNGHFPAFPPAYLGDMPDPAENQQRWEQDPYAEDAMRAVNYILTNGITIYTNLPAADEANLVGFYPETQRTPIWGTDDGVGFWWSSIYITGHVLSALSVANLQGYTSQVGDPTRILGRRFEHLLQQVVDGVVFAQNESDTTGAWYYGVNQGASDSSTSLWGITGLWHAEEFAAQHGIIVPNLAKARAASYALGGYHVPAAGQRCRGYHYGYTCGFTTSAFDVFLMGWVRGNQFDAADTRLAFPGYNALQRGQLRTHFDQSMAFIEQYFVPGYNGSIGYNQRFVNGGNFARTDSQGNTYAMLHWQDAARGTQPEITHFGAHNWGRLFSEFLIRNQQADGRWQMNTWGETISDNYGGVHLSTSWAMLILSPDAIPPLAIGEASTLTAPEGTAIAFNGNESDPGTGNPVYTWDFDNGETLDGQAVQYAFPDNGAFDVKLISTSIGGTSIDTIPVVITNVPPTANAGPDRVVNEGTALPLLVTYTDPGTADTHTFAWDFDDGGTSTAMAPSHTWADNGTFTVSVTVTDDDGDDDTDTLVVTVLNVAPTITSTPGTTATEGQAYTYAVTFTDPGVLDTHTCTIPIAPAGMTITGCTIEWTPSFSQSLGAEAPVRVCVTDNDGGQGCQNYAIVVDFEDADNDGLPDSWEIEHFGDITSQDQFGDPDGDGMNNLQEFNNLTDPNTYDGPSAPVAVDPECGSRITTAQPTLVVTNATDPQNDALHYHFELFSDPGLGALVAQQANLTEGASGETSWDVPVNLVENHTYFWRARARDAFTYGQFSEVCSFLVNTVNEAPGAPRINTPAFGAQVSSLTPTLTVDNAVDPDHDPLTYTFEVYRDPALSNLVAAEADLDEGVGTTSWVVTVALSEDTTYYWRARATDDSGLSGDWSPTGRFFVTSENSEPEAPVLLAPQHGTIVQVLRPDLIILNASDADLDELVYDWQLGTDETFATLVDSDTGVRQTGVTTTTFHLDADLTEDTRYCWRARADDGQATSPYSTACFLVSTVNDPPSVPTLMNPSDNSSVVTLRPTFSWAASTDPEGGAVVYDVEILSGGTTVATVTGVSGTVTAIGVELEDGETYTWRARARDPDGAASEFSAANSFVIQVPGTPGGQPDVVVNGGGCAAGGTAAGGSLVLVALGLVGLRRRRRR